ncbi:protein-L-isoaspartate O-methyltransferase family protein [Promicromonospora sp. MS192]|uniref:protein-L-isoaspartate O-methyltransferase family protein n=1 Tax=Promicromonospora sp. MS192 TaxID=3412684 RepID=UPI003C2E1A02
MNSTRSTITGTDAVAHAARAIPPEVFLGEHGDAVRPITSPAITVQSLRALRLEANLRVLQIGTGSGYEAALMAHAVGPGGHVLTIDADETLTRRAGDLFAAHGHGAIAATGDPMAGHAGRAPYDRIVVHGTPAAIPTAWIDQLAPGGTLVTGAAVSDLPGTDAVAHITKTPWGDRDVTVHAGHHPALTAATQTAALAPDANIVTAHDDSGYWLASTSGDPDDAADLLAALRTGAEEPWPGGPGEFLDLKHWLLARRPAGLFTTVTEHGEGIGIGARAPRSTGLAARPDGPPEAAMITPTRLVANPQLSLPRARFLDLIADWRAEGAPATHELTAVIMHDSDGYRVRFQD